MIYSRKRDRFTNVWWWEPYWAYRPALLLVAKDMIRLGLWLRVWSISSVAALAMWLITRNILSPGEFPWVKFAFTIILLMPLGMMVVLALSWFLPSQVVLSKHGLVVSKHFTPLDEIEGIRLISHGAVPRYLAVCTSKDAQLVGLPSKFDPAELRRCLEDLFPHIPLEHFN